MIDALVEELRSRAKLERNSHEVQCVETHISWVLLGAEAYKIKKPVALPFLDYSTLEAREAACRAEVKINRRLAPRTYLGVVPVRRSAGGRYTFGASGAIVDWAVRMVRLDDACRADVLLEGGALDVSRVEAIARRIAAGHASARTGEDVARYAHVDEIAANVIANFDALGELAATFVAPSQAWEAQSWQLAFLKEHRSLFERRLAAGAIREGHGDLRLEHVFFTDKGIEIIDGVEFDERYRCADVSADVAFLAMDLARLGHVDLAEQFLATYAREANDFDLYRLVDFYESYRAYVRAKIAAAVAQDETAPHTLRVRARADARRYLLLASSAGRRALVPPMLVATCGGIASGKSTLAERLARDLSAPIVEADRTRKHLLGLAPTAHVDGPAWSGAYDPHFSEAVYVEVLRRADAVLASGRPVILDGSFRTKAMRAAARALAQKHGVPFRLVECVVPQDVARARLALRDRATSVSDGRTEIFDAFRAGFEAVTELPLAEHLTVDTAMTVEHAVSRARKGLATWPGRLVG